MFVSFAAMTAWLLRLMPQYVGGHPRAYILWVLSSLTWLTVFIIATRDIELSSLTEAAFGVASSALGSLIAIDVEVHRLPRQISYLSLALVSVLLTFGATSIRTKSSDLLSGVLLMFVMIASLRVLSRGTLGKGDLHLAPLLGILIGWFDPYRVLVACVVMAISGAVVATGLILKRQRKSTDYIAYGPFMMFGAAVAILGVRL